jgi:putative PIN family toxin of toxin-antitoxin system
MQKNKNKKRRLVVDANIWISRLLKKEFYTRTRILFEPENILLVSEEFFRDFERAFRKPYLTKETSRTLYEEMVFELRSIAKLVDVHSVVDICRDPKDNYLLALAKDGNANYLIILSPGEDSANFSCPTC